MRFILWRMDWSGESFLFCYSLRTNFNLTPEW